MMNKIAKDMIDKFYKNHTVNDVGLLWKSMKSIKLSVQSWYVKSINIWIFSISMGIK